MSTEPALLTLTAVAAAIADKKLSSHEVTRACLDRIAQWQPHLNAFMAVEAEDAITAEDFLLRRTKLHLTLDAPARDAVAAWFST